MECAKDMIRESLPIKCLEAVILGMYPFPTNIHEVSWMVYNFHNSIAVLWNQSVVYHKALT